MLTPVWSTKNVGVFNYHQEEPTRYNLWVLLVSFFKTRCLRTGLWAPKLCEDSSSSHWCSDINDLILTDKSPSNTCPVAPVFNARDVIVFISKFLFSPLVPRVWTTLRIGALDLSFTPIASWSLEGLRAFDLLAFVEINVANNSIIHQYPLHLCPGRFGLYCFLSALVTYLVKCDW